MSAVSGPVLTVVQSIGAHPRNQPSSVRSVPISPCPMGSFGQLDREQVSRKHDMAGKRGLLRN
jgi:hypothetical protein